MIKLSDLTDPIVRARNITASILYNVDQMEGNFITKLIKEHIFEFDRKFHMLNYQFNDFLVHILGINLNDPTHSRKPRGAVNFIGSLANTLFGTATQGQIDIIHNRLNELQTLTEEERKLLNVHSSIINVTLHDLTNVHQALDKLEKASRLTETFLNDMSQDIHFVEQTLIALETLLHLQLALSTISADHVNFRVGLQTMLETYVSPNIVSNSMLLQILDDLSVQTPGLLFPAKPEFLGIYRQIIRVISKNTELTSLQGLCFYLLIPLQGYPSDTFNVFEMASLPYPIVHTSNFIVHKPSQHYLVINEGRTSYFLTNDFQSCRKFENLLICPPLGPIYHVESQNECELDIFLERESASTSCDKFIIKTFKPVFIKTNTGWLYSTCSPIDVTLNCINNVKKPRHTINGIGNITINSGCTLHSTTFTIPAYSTQTHVQPLAVNPYPFSTPISLSPWEHEFLKNATNVTLPSSLPLTPIPLPDYIASLQPLLQPPHKQEQSLPNWMVLMWVPFAVVLLIMGLIFGLRRFRVWLTSRNSPDDIPEDPDAVPLPSTSTCPHH